MRNYLFIFIAILAHLKGNANAERVRDKMYASIAGAPCFRRLNGTHQTGCSSPFSGAVGVLHVVSKPEDIEFLLKDPPAPPYAPVIMPYLFTRRNILRLKNEGGRNISAIVLINDGNHLTNFSHELKCPNQYSGLVTSHQQSCDPDHPDDTWNPFGTGLLHEDFPFPIYFVHEAEEVDKITKCFETHNNFDFENQARRSLCSIQIHSFMTAAVNSQVCIRRTLFINNLSPTKYCDPLESKNIYATLFPRPLKLQIAERVPNKNEKFILVSSRMDTTSMFEVISLGAMDSLVSFATLVSTAHVLTQLLPEQHDYKWNVLFMIFNGESYDYVGSQAFMYDLQRNAFPKKATYTDPIGFDNISYMIDIGVLDDLSDVKVYHATDFKFVHKFLERLQLYNSTFNLNIGFSRETTLNLPPTSAQTFLKANISFPAMILNTKPTNRYYHSIFDNEINIGFKYKNTSLDFTQLMKATDYSQYFEPDSVQMKIRNISTVIALSLYTTITGVTYDNNGAIANPALADEFLYCFLQSADCPLFKAASHPNSLPGLPQPVQRYISVDDAPQEGVGWTYRVMGLLTSQEKFDYVKGNCSILPLHWFAGYDGKGHCRLTTHNGSHVISPAFTEPDYNWKSGKYSTWTESTWSSYSARIFLKPSKVHEAVTLAIGFVVMIISFVLVFLVNSKSDILFESCRVSAERFMPACKESVLNVDPIDYPEPECTCC